MHKNMNFWSHREDGRKITILKRTSVTLFKVRMRFTRSRSGAFPKAKVGKGGCGRVNRASENVEGWKKQTPSPTVRVYTRAAKIPNVK